ncbi:hypothetical protein IQ244_31995 [Nostoc sp. LEGE 06077]|uniref:hypothetical protein n=1 Tax=Nostoc sp. LEGE 06077 TaxID=915325 RepID=UPI001882E202|nr:hypothetical protein [Nostoc sp. LEGE 06077]MBE9211029.1 hypothetical protein [Nostoc sp. LEGE 06077]
MKKLIDYLDNVLQAIAIALFISVGLFASGAMICHGLNLIANNYAQDALIRRVNWAKHRDFSIGGIFVCGGGFLASAIARATFSDVDE